MEGSWTIVKRKKRKNVPNELSDGEEIIESAPEQTESDDLNVMPEKNLQETNHSDALLRNALFSASKNKFSF